MNFKLPHTHTLWLLKLRRWQNHLAWPVTARGRARALYIVLAFFRLIVVVGQQLKMGLIVGRIEL